MLEIQATRDRAADELAATRRADRRARGGAGRRHGRGRAAAAGRGQNACRAASFGCPDVRRRRGTGPVRLVGAVGRGGGRPAGPAAGGRRARPGAAPRRAVRPAGPAVRRRVRGRAGGGRPGRRGTRWPSGPSFARQREVEARLVQRTAEERARATAGNAESLRRQARQERQHRIRVAAAEARRTASSAVADQGGRGRPPGRAAAGASRWPTPPPSGTGPPAARAGADAALTAARGRAAELQTAVGPADRCGALRRGAARPADPAGRAAGRAVHRGIRGPGRRTDRRLRPGRAGAADAGRDGRVPGRQGTRR